MSHSKIKPFSDTIELELELKLELETQNPLEGAILARRNVGNSVNRAEKLLNSQVKKYPIDSK